VLVVVTLGAEVVVNTVIRHMQVHVPRKLDYTSAAAPAASFSSCAMDAYVVNLQHLCSDRCSCFVGGCMHCMDALGIACF
jgi:hypothetical protein